MGKDNQAIVPLLEKGEIVTIDWKRGDVEVLKFIIQNKDFTKV